MTSGVLSQGRCLLAWWGALERGGETVGDLRALEGVARILRDEGVEPLVATNHAYREIVGYECVNWQELDPTEISVFIFVCGPVIGDSASFRALHARFDGAMSIAIGVSMLPSNSPGAWNPFDIVLQRDGLGTGLGDFAAFQSLAPIFVPTIRKVGLCLRGAQREYGPNASCHELALRLVERAVGTIGGEIIELDTRLHGNINGADEIEANFESVDFVVTTRMHGALLGIAKGKPTLAIDQVRGGAKVHSVLSQVGWQVLCADRADDAQIDAQLRFLLSPEVVPALCEAQFKARELRRSAEGRVKDVIRSIL